MAQISEAVVLLNDQQLQQILTALHSQQGLWPVASVFMSALLAMIVGILLDRLRAWFERRKINTEKQVHEIQQINSIISGLTFNIELLFHISSQNIFPHYRDSHALVMKIRDFEENNSPIYPLIMNLSKEYPSIFLTSPDIYLLEYDFSKELPFVIEKDPKTVKHSGWLVNGIREIRDVTSRRNWHIEDAMKPNNYPDPDQNLEYFKKTIRTQANFANTECIVMCQLLEVTIQLEAALEKINDTYKSTSKKSKMKLPESFQETIEELQKIAKNNSLPS
jgi:hypothetical protein